MTPKTWFSISILVVIAVVCAIIIHAVRPAPVSTIPDTGTGAVVCTMEAKMCPDGSYVGRTGPKCEFSACPGTSSSSSTTKPKPAPSTSTTKPSGTQTTDGTNFAPYKAGVNGVVTFNGQPYQTMVAVFRSTDKTHAYAFTQTDPNGLYAFSLPPGSYVLGAGETNNPQCEHPEVTIGTNSYITSNIACK
ncbi:MAG TPA: hypothetical protein VF438_03590 [Candidatus Paceibacterota bacterium]